MGETMEMKSRLACLLKQIAAQGVDGFLIPRGDAFSGEEVRPRDERLAYISGFTGSAGMAVVLADRASVFSDARYTAQMREQTGADWECHTLSAEVTLASWLTQHCAGRTIGFDPWLMTLAEYERLTKTEAAKKPGERIAFKPLAANPVDAIRGDIDAADDNAQTPAFDYPPEYAGRGRGGKIKLCLDAMEKKNADAMFISDPAALAWLLNIRGRDLETSPLILAFALLVRESKSKGRVIIFTDAKRFTDCDSAYLDFAIEKNMAGVLSRFDPAKIMGDPETLPLAIADMLRGSQQSDATPIRATSPITAMKAVKTPEEIIAFRDAHKEDALAMLRFFKWFDDSMSADAGITELDAIEKLKLLRAMSADFICPSFHTICGGGAHGAIIHYRATQKSNAPIPRDSLCLIDSGGHYRGASTDITRTIATGNITAAMRRAFTHVLKAHIAVAAARFPRGTTGAQLDGIARAPLWQAGMDYAHGTGHGVGAALTVHEGPHGISPRSHAPLCAGLVLSNEPGYYVEGAYGIRIENLVVLRGDKDKMLSCEQLTLVPYDLRCIDAGLLDAAERHWLNAYHRDVREAIAPMIKDDAALADYLASATREL